MNISQLMDDLERQWFDADRMVRMARAELGGGTDNPTAAASRRQEIEWAESAKRDIMRRIEALEDSLIS